MSYLYNITKKLDNGGYDTTGFNKYSVTIQSNNGVLPTTNYYNDDKKFCNYQSKWDDENRIDDCIDCVSNYGFYGERQLYCDGRCMSKYNTGQVCSDGSLVARNIDQCYKPCYASFPSTFGTQLCKTNVDCNINEKCGSTGFCEPTPYISWSSGMTLSTEIPEMTGMTGMTGMTVTESYKQYNKKDAFIGIF